MVLPDQHDRLITISHTAWDRHALGVGGGGTTRKHGAACPLDQAWPYFADENQWHVHKMTHLQELPPLECRSELDRSRLCLLSRPQFLGVRRFRLRMQARQKQVLNDVRQKNCSAVARPARRKARSRAGSARSS
jgi:hypothetical protein